MQKTESDEIFDFNVLLAMFLIYINGTWKIHTLFFHVPHFVPFVNAKDSESDELFDFIILFAMFLIYI